MAEPAVSSSGHRIRWRWWLAGLLGLVIVAVLIGYQTVHPFSEWVNDVLGSLNVGE